MTRQKPIRVGIMGFGQIGRQIYELAACSDDVDIVAIADIGKPHILHYLLRSEVENPQDYLLEGNFLVNPRFRSRLVEIDRPAEVPWDIFAVDAVIDATGKFRDGQSMRDHLHSGAPRVILRTLPTDEIDRIVIPGLNHASVEAGDRMISAGSATTGALALLLDSLSRSFAIECGSMTTVHAYTSDQALQDYAGSDFRRSRSAAKNIIPNNHEASDWLGRLLPGFEGKILTSALNVPVQEGCLLDVNLVMADPAVDAEAVNAVMREAAQRNPSIIGVAEDPIVSSDVIGSPLSLLFDLKGTIKAGGSIIKTLSWYETRGHAARLLDVVRLYDTLDSQREVA
ncbi:glyceraldehyde 3-phosphate dehydrogenase NAD-binding domain-containing protein [Haliea sp. E17]|uniref:glyceraldehyde 3-phosphate dehydrogenase NAD-binding domain-containing protein n=1 Tax=Haliea sp. E17 TaxID=3401576 RepID=UPI003AAB8630